MLTVIRAQEYGGAGAVWEKIKFVIEVERYGNYYMLNFVLPLWSMLVMSWLTFSDLWTANT